MILAFPIDPLGGLRDPASFSAVFTFIIAVATVAYVIYTAKLFKATKSTAEAAKNSAEIAQKAFFLSHRPYLGISQCKRQEPPHDPHFLISLETKNFGAFPAADVRISVAFFFGDNQAGWQPVGKEQEQPPCEIFPEGPVINHNNAMLSPDQLRDIRNDRGGLLVRLQVQYEVAGEGRYRHTAKFKYVYPQLRDFRLESSRTEKI